MITILCRSLGKQCGIAEYSKVLAERLGATLINEPAQAPQGTTIAFIQFEASLYQSLEDLAQEIFAMPCRFVVLEDHSGVSGLSRLAIHVNKHCWTEGQLYLPLVNYPSPEVTDYGPPNHLQIGAFGFAMPHKRYEDIIALAERLEAPLLLLASQADATPEIENISREYIKKLNSIESSQTVEIVTDFLPPDEVIKFLKECTVLVSGMENPGNRTSGSLRMMSLADRPIISVACHAAEELKITQVESLQDVTRETLKNLKPVKALDGLDCYENLIHWLEVAISYEQQILHHDGLYLGDSRQIERVVWIRDRVVGESIDVGVGNGWTTNVWASAGAEIRWDRTAYASIRYPHLKFYCLDAADETLPGFDTVILAEILEHMTVEEAQEMMDRWAATNPQKILVTTPNAGKENYDHSLVHTSEHIWFPTLETVKPLCPEGYYWNELTVTSNEDFVIGEICRK